jgi:hypothetical protein
MTRDAMIFQCYLIAREKFIAQLQECDPAYEEPQTLFLSAEGHAIRKTSLEKDFERLARACGYTDVQVCLSQFRHRFITCEVVVHLREFMGATNKSRHLMTDSDYRSILKRIAVKTGHGSPESLWHYIDLAWEEMNVWTNVDQQLERVHAASSLHQELLDLRHTLQANRNLSAVDVLDRIEDRLGAIVRNLH